MTTVYLPNLCAGGGEGALSARIPYVGCVLGQHRSVNRVKWARTHQRWLRQLCNSVLFSCESKVTIHRSDGRVRVYRSRNGRYADCCVLERDRFLGRAAVTWCFERLPRELEIVGLILGHDRPESLELVVVAFHFSLRIMGQHFDWPDWSSTG